MDKTKGCWMRSVPARGAKTISPLTAVAVLIVAGVVVAATVLLLSNTQKDTATIAYLDSDWAVAETLSAAYAAGFPTPLHDGNVAICASGACANYSKLVVRDYGALGITSVSFLVIFSNASLSDFAAFGGFFLPANSACVSGTFTHPTVAAISGIGCKKTYAAGDLAALPGLGEWELEFTIAQGGTLTTLEMFAWVEGEK